MNGLQVSSHPQSILGLCAFFEHLLQKHEPELWTHLLSAEVQPTKVRLKDLYRNQCCGSICFWASRILLSLSKKIERKTLIPTVL